VTYVRQPQPDLDQAIDLADRALDTLTGHVTRLADYLAPCRRNPAVRAFTDRTATLLHAA
jgi:hypothetical protein